MFNFTPNYLCNLKTNTILFGLLIIALIFLTACEGETTYTKRISNFSTDTITINIYSEWQGMQEQVFLMPNSSETIFLSYKLGGDASGIDCTHELDSVNTIVLSGKTLVKDIMNNDNWLNQIDSRKNGRLVDQYCDFQIFPIDLKSE